MARPLLATGFIGAYTTWSKFVVEAVDLSRGGRSVWQPPVSGRAFWAGWRPEQVVSPLFTVDNVRIALEGRVRTALAYTTASLILGLGLAAAGIALMAL